MSSASAKISAVTKRAAYLFATLLIVSAWHREKTPTFSSPVYDGFESAQLSAIWRTDKLATGAVELQSEIVRTGRLAAKITIRQHDRFTAADAAGNRGANANERDELTERPDLLTAEDQPVRYAFSFFIPRDFPIVPTRLVLAQWKQKDSDHTARRDNPVVALRYENGTLSITTQTGEAKITRYSTTEDIRGRWLDFTFDLRFSKSSDGFLIARINDVPVVSFHGPTTYDGSYGYPPPGTFYFKMGLYRDSMEAPMTAYFDEYRKRLLTNAEIAAATTPAP